MTTRAWIAVSVTVNVILAVVAIGLLVRRPEAGHADMSTARSATTPATHFGIAPAIERPVQITGGAHARNVTTKLGSSVAVETVTIDLGTGRRVDFAGDFVQLIRRLQRDGVAERTLANLVLAEFNDQWSRVQQDIQQKIMRGELKRQEQQRFYSQSESNRNEAVRALLGDVAAAHYLQENVTRWMEGMGFAPSPEQAQAVYEIRKQSSQQTRDLSAAFQDGTLDQFDYQEQQATQTKEYDRQMTELLGADGYAEMKRSTDWQYGQFRSTVRDLNLGEEQVNTFYDAIQKYAKQQQELGRLSQAGTLQGADYSKQLTALQQEQEKEFQQILGAPVWEQYQKLQDYRYQQLKQFAPAWQLSPADIDHVYATLTQASKELESYRNPARSGGQAADWQAIQHASDDYKRQAEEQLRQYLGEDRFNKLKRAGLIRFDVTYPRGMGLMRYYSGNTSMYWPNF